MKINLKQFGTVINTMQINYKTILNYFDNRSTNASAESFNAKIKAFRAQFRGVRDIDFFLILPFDHDPILWIILIYLKNKKSVNN
ncbi:transposase [Myroides sp. M-43]|nr:transposase [Myroides oncorhynchi]